MDDDNLRIALASRGLALSYRTLHARLSRIATSSSLWVVRSVEDGENARERYLSARGFRVFQVPRATVIHRGVPTVKGNIDHELAFLAGRLVTLDPPDAVLLGTGDGDLAVAVARCLREYATARVLTLSVPGSSSLRLADPLLFSGRLLVGRDLVVGRRHPRGPASPGVLPGVGGSRDGPGRAEAWCTT